MYTCLLVLIFLGCIFIMQLQTDPIIWYMRGNHSNCIWTYAVWYGGRGKHSTGYGPMQFGMEPQLLILVDAVTTAQKRCSARTTT